MNFERNGQCLWKHKGRECLDREFGSGSGTIGGSHGGYSEDARSNDGVSNDQNDKTGKNNFSSDNSPDKDFYRDFQKLLTHSMDISIARSTINLYL